MRELIVVFYGNEISLGIILAGWLLWTAIGSSVSGKVSDRLRDSRKLMACLETLIAAVFPLTLLAVRASRPVFQTVPGEILGPAPMFLTSFVTLSVFCLLSGGLFAAGSRLCGDETRTSTASAASSVYLLEAAGSGLGGILASLVLDPVFHLLRNCPLPGAAQPAGGSMDRGTRAYLSPCPAGAASHGCAPHPSRRSSSSRPSRLLYCGMVSVSWSHGIPFMAIWRSWPRVKAAACSRTG